MAGAIGGIVWLRANEYIAPTPLEPRCRYEAGGNATVLDLNQSHYAGIIVGTAVKRELPARAGSIAMATAYQESGIRNLDYGDRDSLGLFQQRPSQGWGTPEEITDPYYSTNAFYDSLVQVDGWETGDINTVAQTVQRSGHPEAYRKHESNARVVASVLTGHSPGGVSCGYGSTDAVDPSGLADSLQRALGVTAQVSEDGSTLTAEGTTDEQAWAIGHHAVINGSRHGVNSVQVADQQWTRASMAIPRWVTTDSGAGTRTVTVTFTAP